MYTYSAIVERVIDGDTIDVSIDLGFKISHRIRLRLAGIDAAEVSSERGKVTRDMLRATLDGRRVKITTYSPDKYGRYLAEVWVESEVSINRQLIDNGVVKAYSGDSRSNLWTDEELRDTNISKILL